MNKPTDRQLNRQMAAYFAQAAKNRCPEGMQTKLYQQLGIAKQKPLQQWLKPIAALSIAVCICSTILWQQHQSQQRQQAQQDMQIAMHYMQKISSKTLLKANSQGIKPAIIVPIYKSMAKS